jgi:hypothetical protein
VKKIRISANWDTSENITDRLLKQFKTPEIDLTNVQFVYDDSYDIIVFFNHVCSDIIEGKKSYVFPHEPSWNGSHQKTFNDGTIVFGFKNNLYNNTCIETLAHTFYGGRGPWMDPISFWNYENLITTNFFKNKNISSSVTKTNLDYGGSCLYPQRTKIASIVENLHFIDIFNGGNSSPKRHDALVDYKFNISIENEYQYNWISEKFYDCILTDTIPIYFGCKNIKNIYPEDGYILIEDINDINQINELLVYIEKNADLVYKQKIDGLRQIKKRYFKEYNLLKKIVEL